MENQKINVLIIDSGVDETNELFNGDLIHRLYDESLANILGEKVTSGHGTAIYGIIRKKRDIANIYVMHINNIEEGITTGSLINILNYIFLSRLKIDVINLSLGISSCEDKKRLYDACKRLTDLGVVIVSAFNNDGSISYPAAFDNVIGVVSGARCNSVEDFETFDNEVVNIAAKGSMQRLIWTYPKFIFMSGNSFACAHVTNKVIEFMYQGIRNRKEIIEKIKSTAKYHHISSTEEQNNSLESIPFKIKKAVLFPFNKEMHSLIRFSDLLGFEVVEVFDTKYSMTLGAATSHILKHDGVSYKIKSINDIIWDNFDKIRNCH